MKATEKVTEKVTARVAGIVGVASARRPRTGAGPAALRDLRARVTDLEDEVSELRRHNLRLAELADVIQELLVPLASRDDARIREAIETFNKSL